MTGLEREKHPPRSSEFGRALLTISRYIWGLGTIGLKRKSLLEYRNVRVLVIDDHPIVAAGLRSALANDDSIDLVEAATSEAGWRMFVDHRPLVTIIDTEIAGASGMTLMERMRAHDPRAALLIYGDRQDGAFAKLAIERGASGFLGKNEPIENLRDAVRGIAAGGRYLSTEVAMGILSGRDTRREGRVAITARERDVIRLMAHGKSMAETASLINVSYRSVANACNSLRIKLNARTQMELVRLAVLYGIF